MGSRIAQTLGYGKAVDRAVFQQRQAAQRPDLMVVPLPRPTAGGPGALAVDWRPDVAHGPGNALVMLVAELLSAQLAASEREQREAALNATLELQAQAFDTFISMVAHELRSPLTSIRGYAQLLQRQARRAGLPEAVNRSAEAIVEQGTRLADMIEQI